MTARSVAEVEREVVVTYLEQRWKRSVLGAIDGMPAIPDPGYGKDEVCPLVYYGQPFDPASASDLAALSAYAVEELRGYGYYALDIADGPYAGLTLPLNMVVGAWVLETAGGPVTVVPQSTVENGATVVFALPDESTFTADVAATWLHGVGYVVLGLSELGAEKLDAGSNAAYEARVRLAVWVAAPPTNGAQLCDQYTGAIAALFRGLRIKANAAGTGLVKDMADSGLLWIHQSDRETIQERPSALRPADGWNWYMSSLIFRRLYKVPRIGVQTIT